MATLHKEYNSFYNKIKLTQRRKEDLLGSRKELRRKIEKWFVENKPNKLQPTFKGQGSFEMDTTVNPIPEGNEDKKLLKYDLDDGVYFNEKKGEDNKEEIATWHNWVYEAVKDHTGENVKRKQTCVRVLFADGHHIDLPIYYKKGDTSKLAHRSKDWISSDPVAFTDWFNKKSNKQIKRLVRYIKAWKDYRHEKNSHLKLPSGFALTILMVKHYHEDDNDDVAFRKTIQSIHAALTQPNGFVCKRPTMPKDANVFEDYSKTRKEDFLKTLKNLCDDCKRADDEKNQKKASEYLIDRQFGTRFPKGNNVDEETQSAKIKKEVTATLISPKPYGQ